MKKDTFIIGFMLFALFFGAGNLIYPPVLGVASGTSFFPAIAGFVITGIGIPILAVTAISYVKNDARELGNDVHPLFGLIFTCLVYLAIGPFFGIPRAATVGYEMSIEPLLNETTPWSLWLFTSIFFLAVLLVSLNPSKMVDRIGQLLTPILLLSIAALVIGGFILFDQPLSSASEDYAQTPFFTGFIEGYLTMDAIAALAFGIIVVQTFKERGLSTKGEIIKATLKAGAVAGVGLATVYTTMGWISAKMPNGDTFTNGGEILSQAATQIFGTSGTLLLGIIVTLACFTTSVGLVVAASQFFSKISPLSYKWLTAIITLASFIIANQGLNTIIRFSVPVLVFLYPIAIVLIILTFMRSMFKNKQAVYRGAILFTSIVSLYDGLQELGVQMPVASEYMALLPFSNIGLGWLFPAVIGSLIGWALSKLRNQ
ncbi:branched-chain amino acid transport system II carrier protein [Virgibacillus pantothenticus]|uniref:Branched-chain amino acid transport system carrier protein n=1 Tax=Virgibacillus pantothenticus TaxID=1473 RepID=A0A0L0QS33_VIRPA|nr:branched-chain amino acid transport system II carrier protein [Virgibacillus pantothenticus]KNE21475.1 branched-chain amino acid transporter [Virgibacillus pantothenticus]MBU8567394.1 branched-chain amino acid transport system II carrier protein [Virgibacillus pantothenticus]MBU8598975.1 branched-chain amino acid transport system II carrier protein [Virgibacillus pantothenticus]MBU8633759.1 branched-chain amino acid transport system II carrier protein [Virgibacillus pantothenticus]MBU864127